MEQIRAELREYIKANGGVAAFATKCDVATSTVYAWLNGYRAIHADDAEKIEKATRRRFRKERLVFGDVA